MARIRERFEGVLVASRDDAETLRREIAAGLSSRPQATLPAKFLYDERGCALFDAICDTPEYYPTRTERALLARVAPDIARRTGARELVELGSGFARKTPVLLDALGAPNEPLRYVPFDVSEHVVTHVAHELIERYPQLSVRGVVGDFTRDLAAIPAGSRRLVAFLGGTIGNFDDEEARAFVREVARGLGPRDWFLLAADLVKPRPQLHAAYNDAQGLTASFSLNVLERLRRDFGARLDPAHFVHHAFFCEERSRIEIHARALRSTSVEIESLDVRRTFDAGDSIRTEISRKYSPGSLDALMRQAGLVIEALYVAHPPYALVLARPA